MFNVLLPLLIIFLASFLGATLMLFFKFKLNEKVVTLVNGFTSGIMISASFFSLILLAIENISNKSFATQVFTLTTSFLTGSLIMYLLDKLIIVSKRKVSFGYKLFFAMSIHNIPEGLIISISAFLAYKSPQLISPSSLILLTFGIAIQNIFETLSLCLTLLTNSHSKSKSFYLGIISAIIEPISGIIGILIIKQITFVMPYLLLISAVMMLSVTLFDILPRNYKNYALGSLMFGFLLMTILEII